MEVLEFGRQLLWLAVCLTATIFLLSLYGILRKDRRFVIAARIGFYGLLVLVASSSVCLIHGFLTGQYNNEYIYGYSERSLGTPYKIAGLWAGPNGSLLFWTLILCVYSAVAALQHRWSSRHPVGRRLEPYVYLVLSVVIFFFVIVTAHVTNPFGAFSPEERLAMSPDGIVPDGHGLNPQLENYWMVIHPPSLYIGLVGFAIPFAFSMAALLAGEMGDYWLKITRRWTMVAWTFLTIGVILGGLWAYEMLGWGGYWAWDPVENASILPWFVGTAFLHSIMVQERRDMLKVWNVFLIVLTFFMTIVATYMTRSGVVNSVHAFAGGVVGDWFLWFMLAIAFFAAFVTALRLPSLRGKHRLESFFSREAAFFFNNLILLALCATVYFLSMFEKISHDWFMETRKTGIPVYTMVTTPLFLILLFLTAIGPQLGWVKTSPRVFWRRALWPAVAGVVACAACLPMWIVKDALPSPFAAGVFDPWLMVDKAHYYSTLLGIGLSVFIVGTVGVEFYRSARSRVRHRGQAPLLAGVQTLIGNNRRYGGYIVHVGLAILAIGVVWSSNFRNRKEMEIGRGQAVEIPDSAYSVEWTGAEPLEGQKPYHGERVDFVIRELVSDDNVARAAVMGSEEGTIVATLTPEMRTYPKQDNTISVPAIARGFYNDYYIHYDGRTESTIRLTVFVNPLINWIWTGAVLMLLGGIFAALPLPRRKPGLVG